MNRPEKNSHWRLLFREGDLPAGSLGIVINPNDKAGEVVLSVFQDERFAEISFNLEKFYERCQQPAPEPSIGELAEAHEILGREAIELAHDIWCRDSKMDRALAAQGTTRAILLAAYPELRKRILAEVIKAGAPRTSYYKPEEDADWEHFGCEVCGNVFKLPWSEKRDKNYFPMCSHGDNYAWPFNRNIETMKEHGWIQMKRVEIRVKEASDE